MIDASGIRKGLTLEHEGRLVKVIDFSHNKQARGSAQVRLTLRDLRTGSITQHTVQSGYRFSPIRLERHHVQYLYNDGDMLHFMDTDTFDQYQIAQELIGDVAKFVKENGIVDMLTHDGAPLDFELPSAVELAVTSTDPGVKGDTAAGGTKPATLETGLVVNVPLFINEGDVLKIETRSGDYIERAS